MSLDEAAEELRSLSEGFNHFELGVSHFVSREEAPGVEFLLVGVNPDNEEAVEVFELWRDDWEEHIEATHTEEATDQNIVIHEFQ